MLALVLFGLAVLSGLLFLWQCIAAMNFPLHKRRGDPPASFLWPSITCLKPLKGADDATERCLRSWFKQSYPGSMEIIFGVASKMDPAAAIVEKLIAEFPQLSARLLVCDTERFPNIKVSKLTSMAVEARHEFFSVSDADVEIPSDFLRQTATLFVFREIGMVHCFYELANPANNAMRWEAVAVNADFWGQALQAAMLKPVDFALGAVMTFPKSLLQSIGGFESLGDYLADDYMLGQKISSQGKVLAFSNVVVKCHESIGTWRSVWEHQRRWTRTIRFCQPLPFFFSILNVTTFWSLLLGAIVHSNAALEIGGGVILIRMFGSLWLYKKMTKLWMPSVLWFAPLKDLLQSLLWAHAFLGNRVVWRGVPYKVLRGGRMFRETIA